MAVQESGQRARRMQLAEVTSKTPLYRTAWLTSCSYNGSMPIKMFHRTKVLRFVFIVVWGRF